MSGLLPQTADALQRLANSLQILVLVLSVKEPNPDPRSRLVAAAAKQALEDIADLRAHLISSLHIDESAP